MADSTKKPTTPTSGNGNTKKDVSAVNDTTTQALLSKLAKQEEQIALLMKVADKHKIQRLSPAENGPKQIRIRLYEEKNEKTGTFDKQVMIGWRMLRNSVTAKTAFDDSAQMSEITLADGTTREMTYYEFAVLNDEKVSVEVDSVKEMADGTKVYAFNYEGQDYELGEAFIN